MTRFARFAVAALVPLAACDDTIDSVVLEPFPADDIIGVWFGMEEITTEDDLAWNSIYTDIANGYNFPVVIQFGSDGHFLLTTANFATSFGRESDRTCSGIWTQDSGSVQFFPSEACRALPLSRFQIGSVLQNGLALDSKSPASFADIRVRFRLDRE